MDGVKLSAGRCEGGDRSCGVLVDLGSLAAEVCLSPLSNVMLDVWPYKSGGDKSLSGLHAWV